MHDRDANKNLDSKNEKIFVNVLNITKDDEGIYIAFVTNPSQKFNSQSFELKIKEPDAFNIIKWLIDILGLSGFIILCVVVFVLLFMAIASCFLVYFRRTHKKENPLIGGVKQMLVVSYLIKNLKNKNIYLCL